MTTQDREESGRLVAAINAGSSSIKFAVFSAARGLERIASGAVERVGSQKCTLTLRNHASGEVERRALDAHDHEACLSPIVEALRPHLGGERALGIGHRIVHGGQAHREPARVTRELVEALRELAPYDPEHLPAEIGLIEAIAAQGADLPQVACFDTEFHRTLPRVARMLPLPRRFEAAGLERYGFHGLSYAYLMRELERLAPEHARGRVVLAHLGNGASMAAVSGGACIETTMSFTPASGLVMGTRSGDLDPGIARFLSRTAGIDVERFHEMINSHSGLLGVSETSSDMRDLLERERDDVRAAEAVELFCYRARLAIGELTAALGGLDALVFSGGIGENAPIVRERICSGLEYLGAVIDPARNRAGEQRISSADARVPVYRIPTDEEVQIARATCGVLGIAWAREGAPAVSRTGSGR